MSTSESEEQSASINHAVREQLLMLDANLCIRAASKSFYTAFKVGPDQTLGINLAELGNGQWNIPALLTLLKKLPQMDGEFDDLEVEHDFPSLGRRTMQISARRLQGDDPQNGMILLSIQDYTGRKRVEAEVGELLTRFRTTLASIGDAVIVTDPESRITFMNPTAEKLTGWNQADALQKHLSDIFNIVNEQSAKTVESPVARAIRDGVIVGLANHTILIARDGTEWPIDDSAAPIFDNAGHIIGVVLVFHDVTNRRKAASELEVSEIRYRRLFESAHDGILIFDAVTAKVLDVNRFMIDLLGYPREHFIGKELWEIGVFKDAESSKMAMATLQKVGSIRYDDLPLEHRDGHAVAVEFVSNLYREGRRGVIQCNIRDITERRKAAALSLHMAAIVESSDDAIISLTLDGKIQTWNAGAARLFGYTAAEIVGHPTSFLFPPDRPNEEPEILARLQRGERVEHYETIRVAKDGRQIEMSLTASPVRDAGGRIIGVSKILRDITASKLIEIELSKAKEDAEAANRSKSEFLANMSHEIRTPMNAILGFADMIVNKNQDKTGRIECAQIIQRNALHLLELINEILDLSKIEALQMKVERIACNIPELLSEITSLMRPRAIEKGLEFGIKFNGPIPHMIQTDPLRLRQILVNLLGNAIKFTNSGKIDMVISDEGAGTESIVFCVGVIDSGIGMLPNQLDRLFQPFTQGDESITRKFGGTGLGLTISRRLAKLLNGDITVISKINAGSKFTLKIDGGPSMDVELLHDLTELTLPVQQSGTVRQQILLSGRILLVEDGRDNQRLLRMQLGDAGATVVSAENGQVAVAMATTQPFDLILMDMQMPVMDGYAATIELRRRGLAIPIIALTAYAMAEDRERCVASGCTAYLSKPIDEETLLKTVNHHLGNDPELPLDDDIGGNVAKSQLPRRMANSGKIRSSLAANPRMKAIIPEFVDGLPEQVRMMSDSLQRNDLAALQKLVHQLRGAAGGYGFDPITEPATKAEESIKAGDAQVSIVGEIKSLIAIIRRIEGYDESKIPVAADAPAKKAVTTSGR